MKNEKNINFRDYIGLKEFTCSACGENFKNYSARRVKIRVIDTDIDLRPICEPVDPLYYDVIMCNLCGYSTLNLFYDKKLNSVQKKSIKEKITKNFKSKEYSIDITGEEAVERYKLALISSLVKNANNSEKGYICLKLAWVYRTIKDAKNEKDFLLKALKCFDSAYLEEDLPICGMDQPTYFYLMAALNSMLDNDREALKILSRVISIKEINTRIKDRALNLKLDLQNKLKSQEN